MIIDRKLDLSVYYYIKGVFADAPFINVVDGFPDEEFALPTIAVELNEIETYEFELGNRQRGKIRTWYIDIFAKNKSQRDEYAYKLMSEFENDIPVYDYDEGFPPSVTPSRIGTLKTEDTTLRVIRVVSELPELLTYRALVIYTGEYYPA